MHKFSISLRKSKFALAPPTTANRSNLCLAKTSFNLSIICKIAVFSKLAEISQISAKFSSKFGEKPKISSKFGKFSLLKQIEIAKRANLRWIYLGFLVKDCPSLNYKDEYRPYQTLLAYTEANEPALWEFLE